MWIAAWLLGCTGTPVESSTPEGAHEHGPGTHEHAEAKPEEHVHGEGGDHAHHHAGSDHMALMAATRDKLRTTLGEAYDQPVAGLAEAKADAGKVLYGENCASCHGDDGTGKGAASAGLNPPPADFTDAFHARYYSDAGRVWLIQHGSEGTAMPAFEGKLSQAQVLDVYAYVAAFRGESAK